MRVRFLRDFRSRHTNEEFYAAGQVADLEGGAFVVAEGAAELVPLAVREGQARPRPTPAQAPPPRPPTRPTPKRHR